MPVLYKVTILWLIFTVASVYLGKYKAESGQVLKNIGYRLLFAFCFFFVLGMGLDLTIGLHNENIKLHGIKLVLLASAAILILYVIFCFIPEYLAYHYFKKKFEKSKTEPV